MFIIWAKFSYIVFYGRFSADRHILNTMFVGLRFFVLPFLTSLVGCHWHALCSNPWMGFIVVHMTSFSLSASCVVHTIIGVNSKYMLCTHFSWLWQFQHNPSKLFELRHDTIRHGTVG